MTKCKRRKSVKKIAKKMGKAQKATKKAKQALRVAVATVCVSAKRKLARATAAQTHALTAGQKAIAKKQAKKQQRKLTKMAVLKKQRPTCRKPVKLVLNSTLLNGSAKSALQNIPCAVLRKAFGKNKSLHEAKLKAKKHIKWVLVRYGKSERNLKRRLTKTKILAASCKSSAARTRANQHTRSLARQVNKLKKYKQESLAKARKAAAKSIKAARHNHHTFSEVYGYKKIKVGSHVVNQVKQQAQIGIMSVEKVAKTAVAGAKKRVAQAKKAFAAARTPRQRRLERSNLAAARAALRQAQIVGKMELQKVTNKSRVQVQKARKLRKPAIKKVKLHPGDRLVVRTPCKTSSKTR